MQDWMLPKIIDYWDARIQAIDRLSRVLRVCPQSSDWIAELSEHEAD
jgi:hypothetical protein